MSFTDIYELDEDGRIIMVTTYGLPKEEALKNCVLQHYRKRFDTWNYEDIEVTIVPYKGEYFHLHHGKVLFTG